MQYVGQTKMAKGVMFHYSQNHQTESLFYSNTELETLANQKY